MKQCEGEKVNEEDFSTFQNFVIVVGTLKPALLSQHVIGIK